MTHVGFVWLRSWLLFCALYPNLHLLVTNLDSRRLTFSNHFALGATLSHIYFNYTFVSDIECRFYSIFSPFEMSKASGNMLVTSNVRGATLFIHSIYRFAPRLRLKFNLFSALTFDGIMRKINIPMNSICSCFCVDNVLIQVTARNCNKTISYAVKQLLI